MRRTDREQDREFALEMIKTCEYATLATVNPDKTPYCIPVSPILIEETLYFHGATEGKKLENIKANQDVCISCVRHTKLIPEKFTTEYESAVATGKCHIVTDENEKIIVLRALCEKYAPTNMGKFNHAIENMLGKTCVCKIEMEQITGKAN
ncbi:pyridoxamine 5'-phosphate oxidase family protein [Lachnospiraceae bacterium ZAX-1]